MPLPIAKYFFLCWYTSEEKNFFFIYRSCKENNLRIRCHYKLHFRLYNKELLLGIDVPFSLATPRFRDDVSVSKKSLTWHTTSAFNFNSSSTFVSTKMAFSFATLFVIFQFEGSWKSWLSTITCVTCVCTLFERIESHCTTTDVKRIVTQHIYRTCQQHRCSRHFIRRCAPAP